MTARLAAVKTADDYARAAPPHNIEAEQALLGILLVDNGKYFAVFEHIDADDFYDPLHGRIFDAIAKTVDAGRLADVRTLRAQFENEPVPPGQNAAQYLVDLATAVITTINAPDYAQLIHEHATRRRLLSLAGEITAMAHDHDAPPSTGETLIAQVEKRLYEMAERRCGEGAVDVVKAFDRTLENIDAAMHKEGGFIGLPSGLQKLDEIVCGFQRGDLIIFAARPNMGKTALGVTIGVNAAESGAKVMVLTLEMSKEQIVHRINARLTGIPADKQRSGNLSVQEFQQIFDCRRAIEKWPLTIDDASKLRTSQIRGRAIRRNRRTGLDLLVIDYLGLIEPDDPRALPVHQVQQITKDLKSIAKELNIPVVLLSQLNRAVETREDKRPMLSDLRDSGAIEQDADIVVFIYRHEYYLVRSEPRQGTNESDEKFSNRYTRWQLDVERSRRKAELIVQKNRQGKTGVANVRFEGWRCLFTDDNGEGMA